MSENSDYEVEAKYLTTTLDGLPGDILEAMQSGAEHPAINERSTVCQEYATASRENVLKVMHTLNENNLFFGSEEQQTFFKKNLASVREIRFLLQPPHGITQIAIKANPQNDGFVSPQLETNEADHVRVNAIMQPLRELASARLEKLWFDLRLPILGELSRVDMDIVKTEKPFMVTEVEPLMAPELAHEFLLGLDSDPRRPGFLSQSITEDPSYKSVALAFDGPENKSTSIKHDIPTEVISAILDAHKNYVSSSYPKSY